MGLFALSTLLVAGAGVYLLSKAFPNFQPGNKKIQSDLKVMREELKAITNDLIPLSPKELELLSLQVSDTTSKKGFVKNYKGKIQTIFHEPVAAYYYRKYLSRGGAESALLFIQMLDQQYRFFIFSHCVASSLCSSGAIFCGWFVHQNCRHCPVQAARRWRPTPPIT